jgi:signal transduction histidine kinase
MSLPGFPALPWASGEAGDVAGGPAMTTLESVVSRTAAILRVLSSVYIGTQLVIWWPFYDGHPWRLAGPAAAVGWAALTAVWLWRRSPAWPAALLDTLIYLSLAAVAGPTTPALVRGSAAGWLFIVLSNQVLVAAWFLPPVVFVVLLVATGVAFRLSSGQVEGTPSAHPAAVFAFLVVVAAVHLTCRRLLGSRATRVDRSLAEADREAREQYVLLSRGIERREHERLLHDTVLNTLTALARGGGGDTVIGRCLHDVTLMEYALSPSAGSSQAGAADGLLAAVEAVASEVRASGLDVHVSTAGWQAGQSTADIPVPVSVAMGRAVREALVNVAQHAGTGEAWVDINYGPLGTGPGSANADEVQVTVRDEGAGFGPGSVGPSRLGLRRSISERLADWGGRATVKSAPGEGTEVTLCWSPAAQGAQALAGHAGLSEAGMPW